MFDEGEYIQEMETEDLFPNMSEVTTTKKKSKNKRRFTDEQIRSLELIFEFESRLEPRKKMQVAKDLGLQPRQVAIWFQNKRARRKSKQLEGDYSILQANYNNLTSQFESLKKEKQALAYQLQKLKEKGQCFGQVTAMNNIDGDSDQGEAVKCESEEQLSYSMERSDDDSELSYSMERSNDDSADMTSYFRLEEQSDLINMVEPADEAFTYSEDWHNFESDGLFNQSSSDYQWWDFWS